MNSSRLIRPSWLRSMTSKTAACGWEDCEKVEQPANRSAEIAVTKSSLVAFIGGDGASNLASPHEKCHEWKKQHLWHASLFDSRHLIDVRVASSMFSSVHHCL